LSHEIKATVEENTIKKSAGIENLIM